MFTLLRSSDYLRLWSGIGGSYFAVWMEASAAQWFLVSDPATSALAPVVLTAVALPMAVLGPLSGSLADGRDRRRLLITVQSAALVIAVLLTGLSLSGHLSSGNLLILTVLLGSTAALTLSPIQSLVPVVVERERITDAAYLLATAGNSARIVGPALAGAVLALFGHTAVFAVIAVTTAGLVILLWTWRFRESFAGDRERFIGSFSAGVRFMRYSPQAVKILVRGAWFGCFLAAMFALLPIISAERLGLGPSGFGLLLAAQGAGAIIGATFLPAVRRRVAPDRLVLSSFVVGAISTAAFTLVTRPAEAWVVLALGGWAWTACLGTLMLELQFYLPAWVRGRGLALFNGGNFAGQAIGAAAFGAAAHRFGAIPSLLVAAVGLGVGAALVATWPLRRLEHLDRSPSAHWADPILVVDPSDIVDEVLVVVEYQVPDSDASAFVGGMEPVRRIRLRTGGRHWRLLKDAEVPMRFVEQFVVGSWDEYERQRHDRLVASDRYIESAAASLSLTPPVTRLMFRID